MGRRLVLLAALGIACAHTTHTDQNQTPPSQTPSVESTLPKVPGQPPLAATPQQTLKPGAAAAIQHALTQKGYDVPSSGKLDATTTRKLEVFQRDQHLPETGTPDRDTLRKLGLNPDKIYKSNPE